MKRYLVLFAALAVLAIVLPALARRPRPAGVPAASAPGAPVVALQLTIAQGGVTPAVSAVPRGAHVRLNVAHQGPAPVTLALAGYEDLLVIPALAPGAAWSGTFVADRPGDDFAWLLDGEPAGRLAVTGSHLVEGHR